MNQTSWMKDTSIWLGLTTGILGGTLVSTITSGPSAWKRKYKYKRDTLYQNGRAQYESVHLIKQELETEAIKKASS